jgi:hypothetical protein
VRVKLFRVSVARVSRPSARVKAPPRTGGALAVAFTSGLHAAFYASMGFMVLAAALSALRAGSARATG